MKLTLNSVPPKPMRVKTVRLDDETRDILLRSDIKGNRLTLPEQLERASYQLVAKAIEAAGGKWNRKEKCHLFPEDVQKCMGMTSDTVEIVNQKQTFQQFYTPTEVANEVARMADLMAGYTVLEPSVGTAQLARAAVRYGVFWSSITGVDVDHKRIAELEVEGFKQLICADFLTCKPGANRFDRVLMNPPFSMGDDLKHVKHALNFLKPGGLLVAIVAASDKNKRWCPGEWVDLPALSFKQTGTNINTAVMIINKPDYCA